MSEFPSSRHATHRAGPGATPANVPVWDDLAWPGLPRLAEDVAADVCVVGLGGSGLGAVLRLLDLGLDVVGVDAGSVAGGAAGRNGGFLLAGTAAFHHEAVRALGRERAVALYRATLHAIGRIVAEAPDAVRRTGSLRIATTPEEAEDCRAQLDAMRHAGLPVEPYHGAEGEGLLFPEDAAVQPLRRCRRLATRAIRRGARLFEHSRALQVTGNEVVTPRGRVTCGAVLVAVDGGLARVLPEVAGRVRTARLQMLATAPTNERIVPRPVYLRHGYEYYQQTEAGRIALGGFRDRGGDAEWTDASEPGGEVQVRLEAFLRERLGVKAPITHRWAASVGFRDEILPFVDEVRDRVWAIGGYNGTGNVIGAMLGRAVAEVIADGDTAPLAAFRS